MDFIGQQTPTLEGGEKKMNFRKDGDDPRNWGYDSEEEIEPDLPEQPLFGDPTQFKPQPYDPNNPLMYMVGGAAPVKMAQPDYYKEHRKVVGLLNKTGKALLKEGKDQQEEATAMARKMGAPNPFYHLRGGAFEPGRVVPGEFLEGGMINPFDKDGNLLPQFQHPPEFDWIENERRTTNPFYHLQGAGVSGGIAHHPKGHTTRNNNLTKQTPQKKKFCGFVAKKFEHEDYDPAKMHKFRAATCGNPLSHGGRPAGAKNKQGYTRSGQFTEGRKQYGQSKKFRERLMGEGRQLQLMPEEDDLVSKKENPVVDKIIHEPMDDGDIRAYFPKARVMRYADLADYEDIEEVLPTDKSYVFLLYQHRPNDGHFVCIMRYGKTIEFFCSYGSKIDGPLYWTPLRARQELGEGKPWLSMLLKKAGKRFKAVHNPVAFQSKKDGVATCGAYCVMRVNQLVNHNQDLQEFIDWMEELKKETGLSYDEIAANYVNKR